MAIPKHEENEVRVAGRPDQLSPPKGGGGEGDAAPHVPEATTERRAGEQSSVGRSGDVVSGTSAPDPEVLARASRRRFSAKYKLRMLREADACQQPGELGALLRREGLYSSHLTSWRRQRDREALKSMRARKRGRVPKPENPLRKEIERLSRENDALKRKLAQAEEIIDVQKKLSRVLGMLRDETQGGTSE